MRVQRATEAERRAVREAFDRAIRAPSGAARDLYRRLAGKSAEQVLKILDDEIERYAQQAGDDLRTAVDAAAARGGAAAAKALSFRVRVFRLLLGPRAADSLATRAERWEQGRRRSGGLRVSPLTGTRTSAVLPGGRVWLSKALHGATGTTARVQQLSGVLSRGVQAGETAGRMAQILRDKVGYRPTFAVGGPAGYSIPDALKAYEDAARRMIRGTGTPEAGRIWASTRREFERHADTLRTVGSQSAARGALAAIEKAVAAGNEAAVADAIRWYTWNRQNQHLELIAETETSRSFHEAFAAEARTSPGVVGLEWEAESGACGECRAIADGHSDGFPRGCYRWGEEHLPPKHPRCKCHVFEVFDEDIEEYADEADEADEAR